MNKFVVMTALNAALLPAAALAQGGGGGMMQKDQTRAEAQQRTDMMFQMLDANHDGTVTRDEANQALANFQASRGGDDNGGQRGGRLQRMIDEAFATSQSLTLQQFEAQSLARFDAADANHDGIVTAAERQAARGQQAAPAKTVAQSPITTPVKPQ